MGEEEWREQVTKQAKEKIDKFSQNLRRMGGENIEANRKIFQEGNRGKMGKCLEKKPTFSGWER